MVTVFDFVVIAPPEITKIEPAEGPIGTTSYFWRKFCGALGSTFIIFHEDAIVEIKTISDTELIVTVPATAKTEKLQ